MASPFLTRAWFMLAARASAVAILAIGLLAADGCTGDGRDSARATMQTIMDNASQPDPGAAHPGGRRPGVGSSPTAVAGGMLCDAVTQCDPAQNQSGSYLNPLCQGNPDGECCMVCPECGAHCWTCPSQVGVRVISQ
jgi:hypothetical protein